MERLTQAFGDTGQLVRGDVTWSRDSPSPQWRWWVSREDPTESAGTACTAPLPTPPRPSGGGTRPPSASPRGRAPSAGGTYVDSTTLDTVRRRPSTRGRRCNQKQSGFV